ncbi:hypothetical protein WJX73_000944 [Symbiochloris irregularis]|uniref:Protein kinase domain-containing protein n=1 Tax=Symbiochloris irregularis TaxID=706552 RepID=A0AAW1NQF1_9CHLO
MAGLPSPSSSSLQGPPQETSPPSKMEQESDLPGQDAAERAKPAETLSPKPKVTGLQTPDDMSEDDGSRDAFSLPAHTAHAAHTATRPSTPHVINTLKRKEAPSSHTTSRPPSGHDNHKHRSPSPGLHLGHMMVGSAAARQPVGHSPDGKVHVTLEGPKWGASFQKTPQSTKKQRNTINQYFAAIPEQGHHRTLVATAEASCQVGASGLGDGADTTMVSYSQQEQQLDVLHQQLDIQRSRAEMECSTRAAAEQDVDRLRAAVESLQAQLKKAEEAATRHQASARAVVLKLALRGSDAERQLGAQRLRLEGMRLGCVGAQRTGPLGLREVWLEGQAFQDLAQRQLHLAEQKEAIEVARKGVRRKLPPPEPLSQDVPSANPADFIAPEEYVARDEIFKVRLAAIKREEEGLQKEKERLDLEKMRHIKELKRVKDEEASRFSGGLVMHNRFLLLQLIGKGGFSEVFQALDLETHIEVAVKVHQLNSAWSESKKASYVKHAIREYNIHRALQHPRIVSLMDIFEIDAHTFATVLELCPGGELESYLKEHQVLPEKEARVIISQVCSGLAYLNDAARRIIHYDLKPANIMFDCYGQIKLTDFGLSKIVEEGEASALELTSQGAGTYWYLPPECFEVGPRPPLISSKVDVWSMGVVLFQMLYGKRPFGEGCSQEKILRDEIMLHAKEVAFPPKPSVSADGKDFMLKCLAYRQQDRLDVAAAVSHPYLAIKRPGKREPAGHAGSSV